MAVLTILLGELVDLLCVCVFLTVCLSECVYAYVQASVILLSLVCLKMFWEKNILRIIRLVHSKESKRDFSNVFL